MPEIQAFRGIRYNLGRVGSLGDVVTPPYDVIGPELQDHFYKLHPHSFIRIDLNRIEPGDDDEANNRYTRAARFYKQWREEGVLVSEADPAVYVYHQEFTYAGTTYVRRGFMARAADHPFRRGPSLSSRGDPARGEGRPVDAHRGDQGESEPDLRAVPGSSV